MPSRGRPRKDGSPAQAKIKQPIAATQQDTDAAARAGSRKRKKIQKFEEEVWMKSTSGKKKASAKEVKKQKKAAILALKLANKIAAKAAKVANPLNVPAGCWRNCSPGCVIGLGASDPQDDTDQPFIDNFFKNIDKYLLNLLTQHKLNTTLYRHMFWLFCLGKLKESAPREIVQPDIRVLTQSGKSDITINYLKYTSYRQSTDTLITNMSNQVVMTQSF